MNIKNILVSRGRIHSIESSPPEGDVQVGFRSVPQSRQDAVVLEVRNTYLGSPAIMACSGQRAQLILRRSEIESR